MNSAKGILSVRCQRPANCIKERNARILWPMVLLSRQIISLKRCKQIWVTCSVCVLTSFVKHPPLVYIGNGITGWSGRTSFIFFCSTTRCAYELFRFWRILCSSGTFLPREFKWMNLLAGTFDKMLFKTLVFKANSSQFSCALNKQMLNLKYVLIELQ